MQLPPLTKSKLFEEEFARKKKRETRQWSAKVEGRGEWECEADVSSAQITVPLVVLIGVTPGQGVAVSTGYLD